MEHIATLAITWTGICSSFIHCLYLFPNLRLMNVNTGLCATSLVRVDTFTETIKASKLTLFKAVDATRAPLATRDQYGLCLCSCYGLICIDCHISQLHSFLRCFHSTGMLIRRRCCHGCARNCFETL